MLLPCSNCGKLFQLKFKSAKYCTRSCAAIINNHKYPKRQRLIPRHCLFCNTTLKDNEKYCSIQCQQNLRHAILNKKIESGSYQYKQSGTFRKYLLVKRGNICEYCHNTQWMGKLIPLEIEHIDGNSSNNSLENIKLICPNCHALTPTYKSRNKGNGRHSRMKRYHMGLSY